MQNALLSAVSGVLPEEIDLSQDKLYPKRYWVLALFALLATQQSAVWFTFASVSNDAKAFYNITSHDIDLLAMWGPIAFIITVPFSSYMLAHSLRNVILASLVLEAVATIIRAQLATGPDSVIYLHIGAFLNGMVWRVAMTE